MPVTVKPKTGCPLCDSKERGRIETAVREKELLKSSVARELNMTTTEVYNHMMEHVKDGKTRSAKPPESAKLTLNKKDIVQNVMMDLLDRFSGLIESDAELSPKVTDQMVKLVGEIRKSAMDLAKLEGELAEQQKVTIIHFNEFKSYIFKTLQQIECPKCKARIGNALMEELKSTREEIVRA